MLSLMILRRTHIAALSIVLKLFKFDHTPYSQPTTILPPSLASGVAVGVVSLPPVIPHGGQSDSVHTPNMWVLVEATAIP